MSKNVVRQVWAAQVPDGADPEQWTLLIPAVEGMAHTYSELQYLNGPARPRPISVRSVCKDWLITDDPDEVMRFPAEHSCDDCIDTLRTAARWLQEQPFVHVAVCNLTYIETWSDE